MQKSELGERRKLKSKYTAKDMLSQQEVSDIINTCHHPRDKCLIALSYDAALRPHEAIKLRIGDISFHDRYAQVVVPEDTKTGSRSMPITFAFPYVRDWINNHPLKHMPDAYLFVRYSGTIRSQNSKYRYLPHMGYHNFYQLLLKIKKNPPPKLLKRYWNPYVFRHSKLTELANVLTDQQLKSFAGWTPDSDMPGIYIHLSAKDINPTLLAHYGIAKKTEKTSPSTSECGRCKHVNPIDAKFCQCGFVLNTEGFEELKQKEIERDKEIKDLKKNMSNMAQSYELAMDCLMEKSRLKSLLRLGEIDTEDYWAQLGAAERKLYEKQKALSLDLKLLWDVRKNEKRLSLNEEPEDW
ncbi:MAG: tyrosine-type recombinase/integrase [Nitrososphaerales archaeon]